MEDQEPGPAPEQPKPDFVLGAAIMTGVQLVVEHTDGVTRAYRVTGGWRIERVGEVACIIIGHGLPSTFIPLGGVIAFNLEASE